MIGAGLVPIKKYHSGRLPVICGPGFIVSTAAARPVWFVVVLGDLSQIGGPGCAYPIKEKRNGPGFTCGPLPQLRPVVICRACARFALCVSVSLARVRNGGRLLLPDLPRFNLRFSEIVCTCIIFSPAAAVDQ